MSGAPRRKRRSETRPIPPKPTREDATNPEMVEGSPVIRRTQREITAAEQMGLEREELDEEVGERRTPHVTINEKRAPRDHRPTARGGPVLPANASGIDTVPVDLQNEEIDEESMYDRRPDQDKDRPPSQR